MLGNSTLDSTVRPNAGDDGVDDKVEIVNVVKEAIKATPTYGDATENFLLANSVNTDRTTNVYPSVAKNTKQRGLQGFATLVA
jgi:hypothetical protein